nr:MAG TPA: hypothetical protein [Caudoviricetes sp.]
MSSSFHSLILNQKFTVTNHHNVDIIINILFTCGV